MNESINQSINQLMNHRIKVSCDQAMKQPLINQSINPSLTCLMKVMGLFPMAWASPMFALITLGKGFFTPAAISWIINQSLKPIQ